MKKMMMKKLILFLIFVLTFTLAGCGGSSDENAGGDSGSGKPEYTMVFSHSYSTDAVHHEVALKYEELVEEYSDGRIDVVVYPAAQLMPIDEEFSALLEDRIQVCLSINAQAESFDPSYGVFNLPFILGDTPECLGVLGEFVKSDAYDQAVLQKFRDKGLRLYPGVLAVAGGFATTDKKVTNLEEMRNMKIRISGGVYLEATGKAMGFSPITISGAEMPTALMQGTIDGAMVCPIYTEDVKLPVKYTYLLPLAYTSVAPLAISEKYFNALPEDLQEAVEKAGYSMFDFCVETVGRYWEETPQQLADMGVEITWPTDEDYWKAYEMCQPVYDLFRENVEDGDIIIEAAQTAYDTYMQTHDPQRVRP